MTSTWTVSKAKSTDAESIASLLAQSWTSQFTRLQFGNVDIIALATAMAPEIARQIEHSRTFFVVARDNKSSSSLAVVQYSLTTADAPPRSHQSVEETEELLEFEDEAFRRSLPKDSNKNLIMEFTRSLRSLKNQVLSGQQHIVIENLATHPDHRRQGMASRLIECVIRHANEHRCIIYLNTERENPAISLYKMVGFEEVGTCTVKGLDRFLSKEEVDESGSNLTLVALIRQPCLDA